MMMDSRADALVVLVCGLSESTSRCTPLRGSLLAASAARFGPSALKVRSFWMDYDIAINNCRPKYS